MASPATERARRRRAAFLDGKSCMDCGAREGLETHHRDPATKVRGNMWNWPQARLEAEIAKCDVVCHGCHLARHGKGPPRCGTRAGYAKGCRCEPCRAAHRDYMRVYMRSYRPMDKAHAVS